MWKEKNPISDPIRLNICEYKHYYGTTCIIESIFLLWFFHFIGYGEFVHLTSRDINCKLSLLYDARAVWLLTQIHPYFHGAIVLDRRYTQSKKKYQSVARILKSIKKKLLYQFEFFSLGFFFVVSQTPEWRIFYYIIHIYFCHFRMKSLFLLRIMGRFMIRFSLYPFLFKRFIAQFFNIQSHSEENCIIFLFMI